MSRNNHVRPDRREDRQIEAAERQTAYDALTRPEKLVRALSRGHSGTAEFQRLKALEADLA